MAVTEIAGKQRQKVGMSGGWWSGDGGVGVRESGLVGLMQGTNTVLAIMQATAIRLRQNLTFQKRVGTTYASELL